MQRAIIISVILLASSAAARADQIVNEATGISLDRTGTRAVPLSHKPRSIFAIVRLVTSEALRIPLHSNSACSVAAIDGKQRGYRVDQHPKMARTGV
jgi:hypothetical protein